MITKIRNYLYLGDETSSITGLKTASVVIDLRGWQFDLEPMNSDDDRWYIYDLLNIITSCVDKEIPVLVHCHGGIDRSPFLIACWLWFDYYCQDKDISGLECYDEVKALRPSTFIHDDWMKWFTCE